MKRSPSQPVSHSQSSCCVGSCTLRKSLWVSYHVYWTSSFLVFSLYDWTRLVVSVNCSLFSHALQTCCRAAQKRPRSRGGEFPWSVNLLQWHCRIHQPLIRKHTHAGMDQHTDSSFSIPNILYNQFWGIWWFNLSWSLVNLPGRRVLGKKFESCLIVNL